MRQRSLRAVRFHSSNLSLLSAPDMLIMTSKAASFQIGARPRFRGADEGVHGQITLPWVHVDGPYASASTVVSSFLWLRRRQEQDRLCLGKPNAEQRKRTFCNVNPLLGSSRPARSPYWGTVFLGFPGPARDRLAAASFLRMGFACCRLAAPHRGPWTSASGSWGGGEPGGGPTQRPAQWRLSWIWISRDQT